MVDLLSTGLTGGITLVAAFGGVYLAGLNQRRVDERAGQREDARYRREVAARLEEERRRDQLELLRTVQEETLEAASATVRLLAKTYELRQQGGDDSALPGHLRPEQNNARAKLTLHASRLLDDEIRASLTTFLKDLMDAVMYTSVIPESGNVEEANRIDTARVHSIDEQHERIVQALGAAVRREVARTHLDARGD